MNLQNVFEELNKLYEFHEEKPAKDAPITEAADETEEAEIEVADDEAQVVLECAKCGGLIIKAASELDLEDVTKPINTEEACQYCEATEGYNVIGTLTPYAAEEAEEVEETEEVEDEPVFDEGLKTDSKEADDDLEELLDVNLPISANVNVKADGNNVPVLNGSV